MANGREQIDTKCGDARGGVVVVKKLDPLCEPHYVAVPSKSCGFSGGGVLSVAYCAWNCCGRLVVRVQPS